MFVALILTSLLLACVLVGGLTVILIVFARRVVHARPHRITPAAIAVDGSSIEVDASPLTLAPGRYGVWLEDESHVVVGDVLTVDSARGTVVRRILTGPDILIPGPVNTRWSGHVFPGPESLGLPFTQSTVAGASGPCPAWLFPSGSTRSDSGSESRANTREANATWAIHIHGYNTGRVTALRGVPAFNALGFTSLVVSYRGDGEALTEAGAPSGLGTTEYEDVEAAVDFAVGNGAQSIVLVGWSMGALIALRTAERSTHGRLIAGLVLIGPLAGWRWAIEAGAIAARLPALLGSLVTVFLQTRFGARAVGAQQAYPLREFDWTRAGTTIGHRTLVLHSPGDTDVPLASSRALATHGAHRVQLVEFEPVPHCMEWNAEPERFEQTIAEWWRTRLD